jgi:Protein of unknown function (DUF4235)
MTKLLYKIVAMLVSVPGGMLAGAIFKKVWRLAAGADEAPKATDAGRGWPDWPGDEGRGEQGKTAGR